MAETTYVHEFGCGTESSEILGGKGASLARMTALGLPIPPGFVIGTPAYRAWSDGDPDFRAVLASEVDRAISSLEDQIGRKLGDPSDPLFVSIRSGAPVSMPGMMDTLLNVGLTTSVVEALAESTSAAFAQDIYIRLLETFATVVRGIGPGSPGLEGIKNASHPDQVKGWLEAIEATGAPFPDDPRGQIDEGIEAVWSSWDSPRAKRYRKFSGIADSLGTAVTVQAMVFGNRDEESGTGVVFTRDPGTGTPGAYGDFLMQAQGEDVVAGSHEPEPIEAARTKLPGAFERLEESLPILEASYTDMCDVEFTVESGKLWILQARVGQRSGTAAVRIAVDLVDQGLIDIDEALSRVPLNALEDLQRPVFAHGQEAEEIGTGVAASPGAGIGKAVFTTEEAERLSDDGEDVILFRPETSPSDIGGMIAARAVVTAMGGRASHAAVVARGIGRPAICGVEGMTVDEQARTAKMSSGHVVKEGDVVSVDGNSGTVLAGEVALAPPQPDPRLARLLGWCEERRKVPVVDKAPDGYERVTEPEQAANAGEHVLVDIAWEGSDSVKLLKRTVAELSEANGSERSLALALPDSLQGVDLRPPPARWTAVVAAGEGNAWAANLLSARIPTTEEQI